MKKKVLAVFILILCFTMMFTGCCPEELSIPKYITDLAESLIVDESKLKTVNVYIDNTQSMYGFVNEGKGKSNYVIAIDKLSDIVRGYNRFGFNVLKPDKDNYLQWKTLNSEYDIKDFTKKSFYTFSGFFKDRSQGPLQTLFNNKSTVDFDNLNIFITDMAEQNLRNKDLADTINNIVLSRPDYSVLLLCVKSQFSGFASVPVFGSIENGATKLLSTKQGADYTGVRPFYCLAIGQTSEILHLSEMLSRSLTDSGLRENSDFYKTEIISGRGLQKTSPYDVVSADFEKPDIYEIASVTPENTCVNFNMDIISNEEFFTDVNNTIPGICYEYNTDDSQDKTSFNKAKINFLLPLSDLTNGKPADETMYFLETESVGSNEIMLCDVYGWEEKITTVTNEDGEEEELSEWIWTKNESHDWFKSTNPFVRVDLYYIKDGTQLLSLNDYDTNPDHKEFEFPKELLPVTTVNNKSGAILFEVSFDKINEIDYDCISLDFKLFASRKQDGQNIPQWINDFDLGDAGSPNFDNPLQSKKYFEKTPGLVSFYKYLINVRSSVQAKDEYEGFMTKKVSEIPVTIKLK